MVTCVQVSTLFDAECKEIGDGVVFSYRDQYSTSYGFTLCKTATGPNQDEASINLLFTFSLILAAKPWVIGPAADWEATSDKVRPCVKITLVGPPLISSDEG